MSSKMWKKRLGQWNTKDRKAPAIGKPSLRETTLDAGLLNRLPTTQQAQLIAQAEQQAPWETSTPRYTPIYAYMKELPPLDLAVRPASSQHFQLDFTDQITDKPHQEDPQPQRQEHYEQSRPVSEMPSTSSIYTRNTPEMRHDFDPSSTVPPLFSTWTPSQHVSDNDYQDYALNSMPSVSTLRPSPCEKPRNASHNGLAIATKYRSPWQGASGETTLMTPIASATPMGSGSTRSVSPIDETMIIHDMSSNSGANQYPSPESLKDEFKPGLQPAAELKTPTQADSNWEDGVSIGYDVSPWSTPDSRPPQASVIDGSTPARGGRRSFSDSPSYGRNRALGNRFSTRTGTTNASDGTIFEESEPPSSIQPPRFNVKTNGVNAHVKRDASPVTPPMQQGSLVKQRLARFEQLKSGSSSSGTDYTKLRVGTFEGPVPGVKPLRTTKSQDALRDFPAPPAKAARPASPPAISRFSWTTRGTETTYPGRDGTPSQTAASPSVKFFDSANSSPAQAPRIQVQTPVAPQPQAEPEPRSASPPFKFSEQGQSIMSRTRPIRTSPHLDSEREHPALAVHNAAVQIKRKPTPSIISAATSHLAPPTPISTTKPLPNTPTELSTHDYITTLSAQMTTLSHRKHNLTKMLDSLGAVDVGHVNPMVMDLQKRRQDREKRSKVEAELADVRLQERETGLKLLKAEKRRDQEQPSALWVRRVTE